MIQINAFVFVGSILLMIMKMISVGFDMEASSAVAHPRKKSANQHPAVATVSPTFLQYTCYCIMPGTTIFGPFISYQTHLGFLNPTPLVSNFIELLIPKLDIRLGCSHVKWFKIVYLICCTVFKTYH